MAPKAGMFALVPDMSISSRLSARRGKRLLRPVRFTDKGHHGAVGALAGVDVQQLDALDAFNDVGDLLDDRQVTAFGEVRHTFNDFFHGIALRKYR